MPRPPADSTNRLVANADRLRLLVRHLAGRGIARHIELEDIVQEAFLRVLATPASNWSGLDDERLWHYLARAARNTVIDVARALRTARRGGLSRTPGNAAWSRTGGFEPSVETRGQLTRMAGDETRRELERALDGLPAEQRRVLGLRQFEGLSAEQAGRRMGRSASAIHSLYRRALAAWAAALPPQHRPGDSRKQ